MAWADRACTALVKVGVRISIYLSVSAASVWKRERDSRERERVSDHSNPGERVRVCARLRRVRRCVP